MAVSSESSDVHQLPRSPRFIPFILLAILSIAAGLVALTGLQASRSDALTKGTRYVTISSTDGVAALSSSVAWSTSPVGHADCATLADGTLCATPTKVDVKYDHAPTGLATSSTGTQPAFATVVFKVENTSSHRTVLDTFGPKSGLSFAFGTMPAAYTSSLQVSLAPDHHASGCVTASKDGRVAIGPHDSVKVCAVAADIGFLDNQGTSPQGHFDSLTLGGIFEWATGATQAKLEQLVEIQPNTLPGGQEAQGSVSLGRIDQIAHAYGLKSSIRRTRLADLDGTPLGYTATLPVTPSQRRACLVAGGNDWLTCFGSLRATPSRGAMVLELGVTNPAHHSVSLSPAEMYVDTQWSCTSTGCSSGRFQRDTSTTSKLPKVCTAQGHMTLAPAGQHGSSGTLCVVFPTPKGSRLMDGEFSLHVQPVPTVYPGLPVVFFSQAPYGVY